MEPVASVAEVRAADAVALQEVDEATLVRRAGTAVAHSAIEMLGAPYGRRVVVVAGKGNNGADGKVAAAVLARRGATVSVLDAADAPGRLGPCDLVIDAAYGTGFKGTYDVPSPPTGARVLAVDIPSGVDGDTGQAMGKPMSADRTVTFAALKPGLLQGDGAELCGRVVVADIGVPVSAATALVVDVDVAGHVPRRPRASHKWGSALAVVAGSAGMEGAAVLCASGASHAGAGMVRLCVPGTAGPGHQAGPAGPWPVEAVRAALDGQGWAEEVLEVLERCRALVIGPGLGRDGATAAEVRKVLAAAPVPVVADADALNALGDRPADVVGGRPVVLTPHDGEYARLAGSPPGSDRVAAARRLAQASGCAVLLKGPLTAVAEPGGRALLAATGTPRLATAGTGDVLSGVIGAFLARGAPLLEAAALGAHVHGRAAAAGRAEGLVAGDLPPLVARWLSGAMADG